MRQSVKDYKRIVVKIGGSLLFAKAADNEHFWHPLINIGSQIFDLVKNKGKEVVIVSSGAIASGMRLLKMETRPEKLSSLQALAAVGQHLLMDQYRRFFENQEINCAQILLTWDDFDNRRRYLNAKNTLAELLKLKIIPIVNENDTISTEEIKFGDNDRLSALVASLVSADLLIILSDIEGLLDKSKKVIRIVDEINAQIEKLASPTQKKTCTGGMITKIEAARIAVDSGIPCVIADGSQKNVLVSLADNPASRGTLFISKKSLAARERWIAFGSKPKGAIMVDDGAKNALIDKKSLLSVGVVDTKGSFECGDIVSVVDKQNCEFARGKVGISSRQLDKVKGIRFEKEVIHLDNIVIL